MKKSILLSGLLQSVLLLAGPAWGQTESPWLHLAQGLAQGLALAPGSCAELPEPEARLACLKTRIQRKEAGLLPDVLAFLESGPQTAEPALNWLPVFNQVFLLRQLMPALKAQTDPVLRQHLLLLFQYALLAQPQQLDGPGRQQLFGLLTPYLTHAHLPTRLQAQDIWLTHQKSLPQLKSLLASSQPLEQVLGLVHYQRMAADPALKKSLPEIPPQAFLGWTQSANLSLLPLKIWTFHKVFHNGTASPQSLYAFLGQWLEANQPDTVKLAENSLLLLLRHEQPEIRQYALKRLGLTGNPAYASRIESLFTDPDPSVRLRAHDALTQLQKRVPVQYLQSLRDPKRLPPDSAERIRAIMRTPELRVRLLDPAYAHLARQPVMLEELWNLLYTSSEPELQIKALQLLRSAPMTWPVDKLSPLLETSQEVRVRSAALGTLLQRPYGREIVEVLRRLAADPQIELQVEILNYFFKSRAQTDARSLLDLLATQAEQRIDRSLLSFDGVKSSEALSGYIARRLRDWIQLADPKAQSLAEWLNWVRSPALPKAWRHEVLRYVGKAGNQASLLPMLRQLMQDPELAFDAEFALNAVEGRVNGKW
jgi:hypothetical protein